MKHILIAEDESAIREFIAINLTRAGYDVISVADGQEAIDVYNAKKDDLNLVVLDLMMPKKDGIEVCKYIRNCNKDIGIIILSAKSQEIDKVSGLMMGADDYIVKPFSPSELLARVDALFRRIVTSQKTKIEETKLISSPFVLDTKKKTLQKGDVEIELTLTEYTLMVMFLSNKGTAFSRAQILETIWPNVKIDEKAVDVNIRRLRMKIEDEASNPKYISTVWGVGYRWDGE
ncbi:MAG: response regulator transcription factor [Oscillospiraceae bacterium]|nr:response regulator transcription factor [Oscillospiraceae bacterium]